MKIKKRKMLNFQYKQVGSQVINLNIKKRHDIF